MLVLRGNQCGLGLDSQKGEQRPSKSCDVHEIADIGQYEMQRTSKPPSYSENVCRLRRHVTRHVEVGDWW